MLLQNNVTCLASFGANILLSIYIQNSLETYQNAYLESKVVGFVINKKMFKSYNMVSVIAHTFTGDQHKATRGQ